MRSEAQKRAESAYRKKTKQVVMRFYPAPGDDDELYDWIKSQENVTEYLKGLVRADMKTRR